VRGMSLLPPLGESCARISERRPEFNGGRNVPLTGFWAAALNPFQAELWDGNPHAVASPHQHTILGPAQIGNAHGKPDTDRGQRDGKSEGGDIGKHALTEIVRFVPRTFIPRQVELFGELVLALRQSDGIAVPGRRLRRSSRPELQHAVFFLSHNWSLGLHGFTLSNVRLS